MSDDAIESVLQETRSFPPPEAFAAEAHISSEDQYQQMWQRAKDDPEGFWGELATENLDWFKEYDSVLEGAMPDTK
ncbi:MAG: acetyl-coenzyme A synthetase N-terminal domain-containing protein, partial [Planctomycetaceae bacterium]